MSVLPRPRILPPSSNAVRRPGVRWTLAGRGSGAERSHGERRTARAARMSRAVSTLVLLALSSTAPLDGAVAPWRADSRCCASLWPGRFPPNPGARRGLVIAEVQVTPGGTIDEIVATHAT